MKEKVLYKIIMLHFLCGYCNRLLFKGKLRGNYKLEIKCPRCKKITEFNRKIKDNA